MIDIVEESIGRLGEHARIRAAYEGKDDDAIEDPNRWAQTWDLSNWGLLAAYVDQVRAGGCVLAFDTTAFEMLDRPYMVMLWGSAGRRAVPPFDGVRARNRRGHQPPISGVEDPRYAHERAGPLHPPSLGCEIVRRALHVRVAERVRTTADLVLPDETRVSSGREVEHDGRHFHEYSYRWSGSRWLR